jgi:hypothetical protein
LEYLKLTNGLNISSVINNAVANQSNYTSESSLSAIGDIDAVTNVQIREMNELGINMYDIKTSDDAKRAIEKAQKLAAANNAANNVATKDNADDYGYVLEISKQAQFLSGSYF